MKDLIASRGAMVRRVACLCVAGLPILFGLSPAHAKGPCANLLGKQITVRGDVMLVEQWQIGATKFEVIIAKTTNPDCGTIQTTGKPKTCQVGMKFIGTGQLRSGPASRSAGAKRAGATDYGF